MLYTVLQPIYLRQAVPWGGVGANVFLIHGLLPEWHDIVPGGWSIGAEVIVYAMLAIAAPWLMKPRFAWIAVGLTLMISLGWCAVYGMTTPVPPNQGFACWALPSQLMAFGAGFALYSLWSGRLGPAVHGPKWALFGAT